MSLYSFPSSFILSFPVILLYRGAIYSLPSNLHYLLIRTQPFCPSQTSVHKSLLSYDLYCFCSSSFLPQRDQYSLAAHLSWLFLSPDLPLKFECSSKLSRILSFCSISSLFLSWGRFISRSISHFWNSYVLFYLFQEPSLEVSGPFWPVKVFISGSNTLQFWDWF